MIWNISLALPLARTTPQGSGDLLGSWCLRAWSTLAFGHWRRLLGNQTADKKKPNQPLPIHNYHFPGCSFDLLLICKDTVAVERKPSLFSPSLCALGASGTHCHSSVFCHLCVLSKPGTCSGCEVDKCPGKLATATPACSTVLAHHLPVPWAGFTSCCTTTPLPGSNPGFSRPGGVIPTQTLPVTLEVIITLLGVAELANRLHLSLSPLSTPLTLRAPSHLNQPIGSPELWEWAVSSYHTNGSLNQILKPREARKQWVELEASKSVEGDKSKITINSLPLFNYLIVSKHRISYLVTLKDLRSHFLSVFELF